jgi:outer membrane protein TolC
MPVWVLILTSLRVGSDTVTVDVETALQRGIEVAPALEMSRYRVEAASRRSAQASPWPNPIVAVSVENLGQSEEFTGIPGFEGLEGQAILTAPLPFGKERAGAIQSAAAQETAALAGAEAAALQVRTDLLVAIGALLRDQVLVSSARDEAETLDRIAEALLAQAEAGRAPEGDAARARLAAGMARTRLARREGAFAVGSADLSRRLGYAPSTVIRLAAPVCEPSVPAPGQPGVDVEAGRPPELRAAEARVEVARGQTEVARGIRMPDFAPQLGVRRTGGATGLYVGLATTLPLFDRGGERIGASIADENNALAERRDIEERWTAAREAARGVLTALERAGAYFDDDWFESLERTVVAADARYRLGEGTLFELLDSRRARLQAQDDYHTWQAEWWQARLEIERLEGRPAPASIICLDPLAENP